MEKFNYNTDKLVIVAFPMGAGGKFLINSLGVSNRACLQDWELYNLSSTEKKQLIFDRLDATPAGTWNDLDLGCFKQFEYNIDGLTAEAIHEIEFEFNQVVDISYGDKYFFQTTHTEENYEQLCLAFPRATTINLVNCGTMHRDIYNPVNDLNIDSNYIFDVSNYSNTASLLNDISMFYTMFKMKDFDKTFTLDYYNRWQDKING